jgi:hypothetical protein
MVASLSIFLFFWKFFSLSSWFIEWVKTLSEYTYFSFCPKSCRTICCGIIFTCRHSSPTAPAAALAAPQRPSVSAAGAAVAAALVIPGRPPLYEEGFFSNGKDIERKANESFNNGFFFDIEVKRTCSIVRKLFSKRSEHVG